MFKLVDPNLAKIFWSFIELNEKIMALHKISMISLKVNGSQWQTL
jgi:hypothetical protein